MNVIKLNSGQSERRVVECGVDAFAIELDKGAKLELLLYCRSMNGAQSVDAKLGDDSTLDMTIVDIDNQCVERRIIVDLNGKGAQCDVNCVALCADNQTNTNRIVMNHNVEQCTSNQVFRSVAGGESQILFNGMIYVAPGAQKTQAMQQSRNILLSDKARVDTQPQLEIYADDVKCNHGAATGSFDENAIYYMRQRGIGLTKARALLLRGFCMQIFQETWNEESVGLEKLINDRLNEM